MTQVPVRTMVAEILACWKNATQMPAMIVWLTFGLESRPVPALRLPPRPHSSVTPAAAGGGGGGGGGDGGSGGGGRANVCAEKV
eukprot:COSAG04_NODE_9549_length_853_cov_0.798408_2_plen_83_part_01